LVVGLGGGGGGTGFLVVVVGDTGRVVVAGGPLLALAVVVAPVVALEGAEVAGESFGPLPQAATVASRPRAIAQTAGRRTGYRRRAVRAVVGTGGTLGWRTAEPHTS
jgi:hypothetical protein